MMIHFSFSKRLDFVKEYFNLRNSDRESERTRTQLTEISREKNIERTLNHDFAAPAPYHMPFEVVSVRVRAPA